MIAKRVSKAEQFQLILECRQSGLTDAQWCRENNIRPSTFYNWVSRMREGDYVIPESRAGECSSPNQQDVVRLDIFQDFQKTNETSPHPIGKPQDNSLKPCGRGLINCVLFGDPGWIVPKSILQIAEPICRPIWRMADADYPKNHPRVKRGDFQMRA